MDFKRLPNDFIHCSGTQESHIHIIVKMPEIKIKVQKQIKVQSSYGQTKKGLARRLYLFLLHQD